VAESAENGENPPAAVGPSVVPAWHVVVVVLAVYGQIGYEVVQEHVAWQPLKDRTPWTRRPPGD